MTDGEDRIMRDLKRKISAVEVPNPAPLGVAKGLLERGRRKGQTPHVNNDAGAAQFLYVVRDGLMQDRIELYLQPIVQLPERNQVHYECFSRIRAPDGSMVRPAQYIATAKEHGLLGLIDNILLLRCIQLICKTQGTSQNIGFFCNISVQTLSDRGFLDKFISFLEENRDLSTRLILEFAEEDIVFDWGKVDDDLRQLARLGFRFSMDRVQAIKLDAARMASCNFKFVKIAADIILSRSLDDSQTLEALRRDLKLKGVELIVDKVETQEQLTALYVLGFNLVQGYLLGEPQLSRRG